MSVLKADFVLPAIEIHIQPIFIEYNIITFTVNEYLIWANRVWLQT